MIPSVDEILTGYVAGNYTAQQAKALLKQHTESSRPRGASFVNLYQRFLGWRIARHDARAKVFAAATVAAKLRGDTANAARFQERMHHAQAVRDGLAAHLAPSEDPELLAQCADQMSAAQYVAHHTAGDFRRC